jgi:hypothetical protein
MSIATLHIAFEPRGASEKDERVYNSSLLYTSRAILLLRMGRNDVLSDVLPFRLNPSESIASCKSHRSWEETVAAAARRAVYTNIQTYTLVCDGTKLKTFLVICVMDYTTTATTTSAK